MGCIDLYDPLDNRIHLYQLEMSRKRAKQRFRYWIFRRWAWRCAYCGQHLHPSVVGRYRATLDHVKPKYLGGKTTQNNLVPACPRCNENKANKVMEEWYVTTPFFMDIRLDRIHRWQEQTSDINPWYISY